MRQLFSFRVYVMKKQTISTLYSKTSIIREYKLMRTDAMSNGLEYFSRVFQKNIKYRHTY